MKKLLLLSVCTFMAANAALIPSLDVASAGTVVSVDPGTGDTEYSYTYLVTANPSARMVGGNPDNEYFVLYDFAGYLSLASVTPPGGWTVTPQNVGPLPTGITVPGDDADIANLVFRYSGAATGPGASWSFDVRSSIGPGYTRSYFSSSASNAVLAGTYVRNWGEVLVPSTDSGEPGPIPEPLTMGLIGGGLAGMGLLRRFRKN